MVMQAIKVGDEFIVNDETNGTVDFSSVTRLANGGFVVTWMDSAARPASTDTYNIKFQLFDADGDRAGAEFTVATRPGGQMYTDVASLGNGGFVVVWADSGNGAYQDIRMQIFAGDGTSTLAPFPVTAANPYNQYDPRVTVLTNGNMLVTYGVSGFAGELGSSGGVAARIVGPDGMLISSEFLVNTTVAYQQKDPDVTSLAGGGFVVTWEDWNRVAGDPTLVAVRAQIYSATGARVGGEMLINSTTQYVQSYSSITAFADGGFAIAWTDLPTSTGSSIKVQMYGADGTADGAAFAVSNNVGTGQRLSAIATLPDDMFVVVWETGSTISGDGSLYAIKAQVFASNGMRIGEEFLVNSSTQGNQTRVAVTGLSNDQFVVTWTDDARAIDSESGNPVYDYNIRSQIFSIADVTEPPVILSNGGGPTAAIAIEENDQLVTVVVASDPDGPTLTYHVSGGADAALFTIDAYTGALTFTTAPNFEAPGDAGGDNIYEVIVSASDSVNVVSQALTVTVTDAVESSVDDNGNTTTHGTNGDDVIDSGTGVNFIFGYGGNDRLTGSATTDYLDGGDGNDQLNGGAGYNFAAYGTASAGVSVTLATQGVAQDTLGAGLDVLIDIHGLVGSAYADTLTGDGGFNMLDGGAGADVLAGGLGDDYYFVDDAGDNVVEANNAGNDIIYSSVSYSLVGRYVERLILEGGTNTDATGNALANILDGNAFDNILRGGGGDDVLRGYFGNDVIDGGAGFDIAAYDYVGNSTGVAITLATPGVAQAMVGGGSNSLTGIEGLVGSMFDDSLTGDASANMLDGNYGADLLTGGRGNDVYYVDDAGDVVVELSGQGVDEVRTGLAAYVLTDHVEALAGLSDAGQGLTGNARANSITGAAGGDVINGGAGADVMQGGLGDDVYIVDTIGDSVVELAGQGVDEIRTALTTYTLAANIETLRGLGTSGQTLNGNALANGIVGGVGSDRIDGGAGADSMSGGRGNDIYIVDDAGDVVTELPGEGVDEVRTGLASYTLTAEVEGLTALSGAGQVLTGNARANTIAGGTGADVINGGTGADLMKGDRGDDIYYVDRADDLVVELSNEGTDLIYSSATYSLVGSHVEKLVLTGNGVIDATGNILANELTGNGRANVLDGGGGSDLLAGGAGADLFRFSTAPGAGNIDTILDFSIVDDAIALKSNIFKAGPAGVLAAGAFQSGAVALDAGDRILYDAATGNIWYDSDGTGAVAAVQFASVTAGLALTNADFQIV